MGLNAEWMQRDLEVLWHPCTQMKDHERLPVIPIRRGKDVWLEDFEGKRYLDAVSSWWVNVFGHANPRINQRIKDQVDQLEHVILAGFTHAPVVELSERLVRLTPEGLSRVFYADNGSSGIEVALKMSYHYWQNCGQPAKKRFVTLTNSYHGETVAAMSVGDVALFTETYKSLLLDTLKVPSPDCYLRAEGESWEAHSRAMFEHMERTLEQHHREVAAVIVEPLIQGAGGMRMYHPVYLELLREACDRYGVHLIHDEIAVGFGRTGSMFACEQAGITPDFLVLSKALTGGYLPMAAVLTTDTVYQAFYDDYATLRADWSRHNANQPPVGAADRAKFDEAVQKLTAPDAESKLYAELQPKLSQMEQQYKDQLPVMISVGDALLKNGVAQNRNLDSEQKTQANQLIDVLVPWAQKAPWFDQDKAKQAVGVVVAAARKLDLKSPEQLRSMDFDTAMAKYATGYAGLKQLLAIYGLSVDEALDSVRLSTLSSKDGRAVVKVDYTLLGKPLSAESTLVQQDGRWYSESLIRNVREAHQRLQQPAAAGSTALTALPAPAASTATRN